MALPSFRLLPAPPTSGVPEAFEEYRLLRMLGRGAMGEVYLANDTLLQRAVAIKFLSRDGRALSAAQRRRFKREARAVARVQHPNVVSLFRTGEVDGRPFLVSEYLRGQSLDLLRAPLPWERVLSLSLGLLRGLAAAHRQGVLHRDLKPANAFLTEDGEVKLLDFGLAQVSGEAEPVEREDAPEVAAPLVLAESPAADQTRDATYRPLPCRAVQDGPRSAAPARSALAGTPLYMAPELWRGEDASPRSDVYSFGALVYALCAGEPPFARVPLAQLPRRVQAEAPRSLVEQGVDPRFALVVERCLHRDPRARYEGAQAVLDALERLVARPRAWAAPDGNPFRGLRPFEAEHQAAFFGRAAEVAQLSERLQADRFVVVAGDSGVGKSSLVRAGLVPALSQESGPLAPTVLVLSPGRRPLQALAELLSPVLEEPEAVVAQALTEEPAEVGRQLRQRFGRSGLTLIVDPLEELVTLSGPAQAAAASEALAALALEAQGARLVATVRSDFLGRVAALPRLGEDMGRALYWLRALSTEGLREVVVGPVQTQGFGFESEALVEGLVGSVREGGALPLLQFALAQLWERRDAGARLLRADALQALGGVEGCLARHADSLLQALSPAQQDAARALLMALVTAEGTRSRRTCAELTRGRPAALEALEALVRGRLVVARSAADEDTYELAHEALITRWATLRGWLQGGVAQRILEERVQRAAREWRRLGRTADALLGPTQLKELEAQPALELGPLEAEFLQASAQGHRQRRRRRWVLLAVVPAALALGLLLTAKTAYDRRKAREFHRAVAERSLEEAQGRAREGAGLRAAAFARFDAQDEGAEESWRSALEATRAAESRYDQAEATFEQALQVDSASSSLREGLATLLVDRALQARALAPHLSLDALQTRLRAHDVDGVQARRLTAPARVSIAASPPEARVALSRYSLEGGRYREDDAGREWTAGGEVEIAPGSVVFTLTAPGRRAVRLPAVLRAGEDHRFEVALPSEDALPSDYVYVPAGSFLHGSAADDGLRRFFLNAAPLHERATGDFWIARREVTFAEWIEFLEALPPAERARRSPGANAELRQNSLRLGQGPRGRWRLSFQMSRQRYEADAGRPLRYVGRARRSEQDWLRFPVSAISFSDAQAYVGWLSQTGRVPGARLCSDAEWERAARGADGRTYPAGEELSPEEANFDLTYGRVPEAFGPDEVGSHPESRSPFGLEDTAGNVWELTHADGAPQQPMMRGGSWYHEALCSQLSNRERSEPQQRDALLGLRVCATPSPTPRLSP